MYRTKDNKAIGKYLSKLIDKHYGSNRKFCIAYLEKRDGKCNSADIQNMQNRICQIKNGNKGVQIVDLPIFSELLHVSVDDILSAGTALIPSSTRQSNYSIAFSKDPKEWKSYLENEDKPFLNPDEFNKTTIDYALEAENYALLKSLVDEHIIYFVGNNEDDYHVGFGAGTTIKRREIGFHDPLEFQLKQQDDLRFKMIELAVKAGDLEMLDTLHAREIPQFYTINRFFLTTIGREPLSFSENILSLIDRLSDCDDTLLNYFFSDFTIHSEKNKTTNTFFFPYAGRVLDLMICKKRNRECKKWLKKAIDHNNGVLTDIRTLVSRSSSCYKKIYENATPKTNMIDDEIWRYYYFFPETGIVSYHTPLLVKNAGGFTTNIVNVTERSDNRDVNASIGELNKSYDYFSQFLTNKII